jgi:hypothetical protein
MERNLEADDGWTPIYVQDCIKKCRCNAGVKASTLKNYQ